MTIQLCINKSEPERLTKQVSVGRTFSGNLIENTDILSPSILLNTDANIMSYNYARIPEFNRYYFIDDIINEGANLWRINMSVDVASTYAKGIRNQSAIISKQENSLYNKDYNDGTFNILDKTKLLKTDFPQPFNSVEPIFLLTVV